MTISGYIHPEYKNIFMKDTQTQNLIQEAR